MRKWFGMALSCIMVLAMGIQALAAPSIVGSIDKGQVASSEGSVTWDEFNAANYSDEMQALVNQLNNAGVHVSVKTAFGNAVDLSSVKIFDTYSKYLEEGADLLGSMYFLSPMLELTFVDVEPSETDPVRVTFTANNMTSGMKVYVLYYCPEHGWELLETERTADNQVTAAFHSGTSLAALVYIDEGVLTDIKNGVSPKTGEGSTTLILAAAALLLFAFGLFALKKSRKSA